MAASAIEEWQRFPAGMTQDELPVQTYRSRERGSRYPAGHGRAYGRALDEGDTGRLDHLTPGSPEPSPRKSPPDEGGDEEGDDEDRA
jgi:hypothetical protein